MTTLEVKESATAFVAGLEAMRERNDRGTLVRLKCGLIPSLETTVYPYIGRCLPSSASNHGFSVGVIVGGLYGLSRQHSDSAGDICASMHILRLRSGSKESVDRMANHLISARSRRSLYSFLAMAVRRLKSEDISINFVLLYEDLFWWNKETAKKWARSYFRTSSILSESETLAAMKG